ncbi:class I SAM-dependent RNA methyltransferase [Terasakiella sp. SH-1]|uniref:THUMP domain-containing class I SAM-dependent RNA methyltransferase n=1 Tax=Terasakiella sp. SH-1 TaxID=2560057 RepID=UPI00107487CB|nr:class I SAM-dependent RNA methyltransferase [Terasakiella sp. SH-1]
MNKELNIEIFLVAVPGLEDALLNETRAHGFRSPKRSKGGITIEGRWHDVWRANLVLRGASKVLARIGSFRAMHLAQLDKRARKFNWSDFLRPDVPVRIEVSCKKSKIYHQKAAAQRIERAITEELGAPVSAEAEICIKVRILEDLCTISIDTSGEGLHKRGHKEALNKAPMRETLASLILRQCGFDGSEPVIDPMCGSGTFVMEAAEMASQLAPGRSRSFAFEQLVTFDPARWHEIKDKQTSLQPSVHFYGFDRDGGAIQRSQANAKRAGITESCTFTRQTISQLKAPDGPKGLIVINPPYGVRIGEVKKLFPLYQSLGNKLKDGFSGWRVGIVTNSDKLAKATGLKFNNTKTAFSHGGIRVTLYQAEL